MAVSLALHVQLCFINSALVHVLIIIVVVRIPWKHLLDVLFIIDFSSYPLMVEVEKIICLWSVTINKTNQHQQSLTT